MGRAIKRIINYVENQQKTAGGQLISSYRCNAEIADAEFRLAKQRYIQKTGRTRGRDDVIAYHLRQAFVLGEITGEQANRMGRELALRFTKGNHAFIVCTHVDKAHIHNHIIFNAVNTDCDRKYRNFWGSSKALRRLNDILCVENGYSVVDTPGHSGVDYGKWLGGQATMPHRERLRLVIDEAMSRKPDSFAALLQILRDAGYEVGGNPTNPSLRSGAQKRAIRMDTLGPGYTPLELKAVIAGKQSHTPKQRKTGITTRRAQSHQLLIDIQQKLAEKKGRGYETWARRFNLKQMAKTVAYLQEKDLLDYSVLALKAEKAARDFRALSDRIKKAEKRLAEISVMRTQIINYARTREVYIAYRKAGYSKKFRAEHEGEILLHLAAKRFFDEQQISKLPSTRELRAEYAALLAEKKAAYAEYRTVREKMKELQTAKMNVDMILEKGNTRTASEKGKTEQR